MHRSLHKITTTYVYNHRHKVQVAKCANFYPAPTSTQDGLDSLQLALAVFFMSSLSAKTSLALAVLHYITRVFATCTVYYSKEAIDFVGDLL